MRLGKLSLALAAVLGLSTLGAKAEDVTLNYSNWLPATYFVHTEIVLPWFADIERVTEGRVKITITPKAVGTVAGQYDVIAEGLADIGFILPGYTPGRFPLVEGLELPFLGDDPVKRCAAAWQTYEKFIKPAGSFKEVEVLGLNCTNVGQLALASRDVNTIEDLAGLKLRTPAPVVTEALELLGAIPINKPASEIYELASTGVIDGAIIPLDSMIGFKLDTVLKKVKNVPGGMVSTVILYPINKDSWARISEADQKAILAVSGEVLSKRAGEVLAKQLQTATAALEKGGVAITVPDASFVAAIKEKTDPARQNWIAKAKAAGMEDPAAMLSFFEGISGATH
jgi:TRAP-type C4-dicarboxylate transport system substrate-binding protein